MNERKITTPQEYHLLRRLDAVGCPVNWNELAEPCCPLRLIHEPGILGTELFPMKSGTGLAFRVDITASVEFSIRSIRLQAKWLRGGIAWLDQCATHERCHCFHGCFDGDVRFSAGGVVNRRFCQWPIMRRGESVRGQMAFILSEVVSPSVGSRLPATLWFEDRFGTSYPYDLTFENSQQVTHEGDSSCRFVSSTELDRERAAYLATQAARAQPQAEPEPEPKKGVMVRVAEEALLKMEREAERKRR